MNRYYLIVFAAILHYSCSLKSLVQGFVPLVPRHLTPLSRPLSTKVLWRSKRITCQSNNGTAKVELKSSASLKSFLDDNNLHYLLDIRNDKAIGRDDFRRLKDG